MYLDSPSDGAVDTPQTYGSALVNRMETVFREVLETSTDQRLKREYYFNRYEKFRPFKVGDLVWMNDPTTQRRKLEPKWTGPYRVVTVDMAGVIYTVLNVRNVKAEPKVVHYERLKPYRSKWTEPAPTSTCAGQDKNKIVQDLRPLYTALSGSLPLSSGELWVGENEAPILSSVPHVRRPSGRIAQVPHAVRQPPQLVEHTSSVGGNHGSKCVVTHLGRVSKRPRKYSCKKKKKWA